MLDLFENAVHKEILSFDEMPHIFENHNELLYSLSISSDLFPLFLKEVQVKYNNVPLDCVIYDDVCADMKCQEDFDLRYKFLKKLNSINIHHISFFLSDSTLPIYNVIMNSLNWKYEDTTTICLSIDRHPLMKKNLMLEQAKGKLHLSEEKLIWLSNDTLNKISDKVDSKVLSDTFKLKDFLDKYYLEIEQKYNIQDLTPYDLVMLAQNYVVKNIEFPKEMFARGLDGIQYLKSSNTGWEKTPYGTLEHKMGTTTGKARLMAILLNNYYSKIYATAVTGHQPNGPYHSWVELIIDDKIYQCYPNINGAFINVYKDGFDANKGEMELYQYFDYSHLNNHQVKKINSHLRKLEKANLK